MGGILGVFVVSSTVVGVVEGPTPNDHQAAEILLSCEALSHDPAIAVDVFLDAADVLVAHGLLQSSGGGLPAGIAPARLLTGLRSLESIYAPQPDTLPTEIESISINDSGIALKATGVRDGEGSGGAYEDCAGEDAGGSIHGSTPPD
jgi:hypothetical protein